MTTSTWGFVPDGVSAGAWIPYPVDYVPHTPLALDLTNTNGADFVWADYGLALGTGGFVYVWNIFAALQHNEPIDPGSPNNPLNSGAYLSPEPCLGGDLLPFGNIVKVRAGFKWAMALDTDGNLYAWGLNRYGQFGNPDLYAGNSTTNWFRYPTVVNTGVTDFFAGFAAAYCLKGTTLFGAGSNSGGNLLVDPGPGPFDVGDAPIPTWTEMPYPGTLVDFQATAGSTILIQRSDGSVIGAGQSRNGILGVSDGANSIHSEWLTVPVSGVTRMGTGAETLYVQHADGSCQAIGSNQVGALGAGFTQGTLASTATPVAMVFPAGVTPTVFGIHSNLGIGSFTSSAAICNDEQIYVWGTNLHYAYGNGQGGSFDFDATVPIAANGLIGTTWLVAGDLGGFAGDAAGDLWLPAWQTGDAGKLDFPPTTPGGGTWDGTYVYVPYTEASPHQQVPFFDQPYVRFADGHWHPKFYAPGPFTPGSTGGNYLIYGAYAGSFWAANPDTLDIASHEGGDLISGSDSPMWIVDYRRFPIVIDQVRLRVARTGVVGSSGSVRVQLFYDVSDYVEGAFYGDNHPLCTATVPFSSLPLVSASNNYTSSAAPLVPTVDMDFDVPLTIYGPPVDGFGNPIENAGRPVDYPFGRGTPPPPFDPVTGIRSPVVADPWFYLAVIISTTDSPSTVSNLVLGCTPIELTPTLSRPNGVANLTQTPLILNADRLPGAIPGDEIAFTGSHQDFWSALPYIDTGSTVGWSPLDGAKAPSLYLHIVGNPTTGGGTPVVRGRGATVTFFVG